MNDLDRVTALVNAANTPPAITAAAVEEWRAGWAADAGADTESGPYEQLIRLGARETEEKEDVVQSMDDLLDDLAGLLGDMEGKEGDDSDE